MTSPRMTLDADNAVELTGKTGKEGLFGLLWYHVNPQTREKCVGGLSWDPDDRVHWDLISLDPLTISPSLLCLECRAHGFIRDGKWIPA